MTGINANYFSVNSRLRKRNEALADRYLKGGTTFTALAKKHGISPERVRQVVHREIRYRERLKRIIG